jgi:hypothetical protein
MVLFFDRVLSGFWNRIIPAFRPGMTPGKALHAQPGTTNGTMFFQGFHGVTGTGRRETAVLPDKRAQSQTVDFDETNQKSRHC